MSQQTATSDAPRTPFFRPEALEQQKVRWLGEIKLAHPFSFWLIGALAISVAACILCFLFFASYTKRATVAGRLMPEAGQNTLVTSQGGRLAEVRVVEGAQVKAGDILFVLTLDREGERLSHEGAVAEKLNARKATLDTERSQQLSLANSEASRLRERRRSMEMERVQLDRELATALSRLAFAEQNATRFKKLAEQGFMSGMGAQGKEEEVLDLRARMQGSERTRTGLDREIAGIDAELATLPTRTAATLTTVAKQSAALEQEAAELGGRRTLVIRAPEAGVVTALSAQHGQWLAAGQTLATLLPAGSELIAEIYAPSRAVGFVQLGQRVLMRYAPFPYQKFGQQQGEVIEVSRTAIAQRDLPQGALPSNVGSSEGLYRVRVRLSAQTISTYGQQQALAAGTQLDADIELDRRRLVEWVFEPLLSLKGRVAS